MVRKLHIEVVETIFFIISRVCVNMFIIVEVKILVLMKWSCRFPSNFVD